MLIEPVVQLVFIPILLVRKPLGELVAPFLSYSQLFQKGQGQFIKPEDEIGSTHQDPKKTEAVFACSCAISRIEGVAQHMTLLVLAVYSGS